MTAAKMGRPRTPRMTEALQRVANGETAYSVARSMGIRYEYLCKQTKKARQQSPG